MAQVVKQQPSDDAAVRAQIDKLSGELKKVIAQNQALRQAAATSASSPSSASTDKSKAQGDVASAYNAGLNEAMQLYKTNDYAGAYAKCVQITQLDGGRWEAYFVAGLSLDALNKPTDAQAAYQYALAQAPEEDKTRIAQRITTTGGNSGSTK